MNIINEAKALRSIRFGECHPFLLMLDEQRTFQVDSILRLIPGRRLVVAGTWQQKRIVAKLFFDKRHASRHAAAEMTGIKLLRERNIPSPNLCFEAKTQDGKAHVLVFDYLRADIDLTKTWQQQNLRDELLPLLKMLVMEIATQHVFGLVQRDLHLNNFIFAKDSVYTLDAAQIESCGDVLTKKESMQNLALLFSQLGVDATSYQETLFDCYVNARGWIKKTTDLQELFFMIDMWGRERWNKFDKKIFRNSTHFSRSVTWRSESVFDRSYCLPEFIQFMQQPDAAFNRKEAIMLKNGRSSTVIRITLDGRDLVIKRYNMKSVWHWLRRCFRATRAKTCWRIAQKLRLFGVNTATPVAYIETHFLGLRGKSYFITEFITGENVSEYLQRCQNSSEEQNTMIKRICSLFSCLKKIAVTHGDLKATNLLVKNDEPVLIDLDGACEHVSPIVLKRTSQQEWQRFLRNFDATPTLKEKLIYETDTE